MSSQYSIDLYPIGHSLMGVIWGRTDLKVYWGSILMSCAQLNCCLPKALLCLELLPLTGKKETIHHYSAFGLTFGPMIMAGIIVWPSQVEEINILMFSLVQQQLHFVNSNLHICAKLTFRRKRERMHYFIQKSVPLSSLYFQSKAFTQKFTINLEMSDSEIPKRKMTPVGLRGTLLFRDLRFSFHHQVIGQAPLHRTASSPLVFFFISRPQWTECTINCDEWRTPWRQGTVPMTPLKSNVMEMNLAGEKPKHML